MAVLKALLKTAQRFKDTIGSPAKPAEVPAKPRIGLALAGGFARGIAHIGVLRAFEKHRIPIDAIAGVSAGAIIAAAYASGSEIGEIEFFARRMTFRDVASWTLSQIGFVGSEKMTEFLQGLLKVHSFEEMRIPLAVVASDLSDGKPWVFRDQGDVCLPIRASCAYPGLFQPVRYNGKLLVDGAVTMEIPARPLRDMGVTHVISVALSTLQGYQVDPGDMFSVVNRCFQILQVQGEREWRAASDLVLEPGVGDIGWDGFADAEAMIHRGELAVEQALPQIERWLAGRPKDYPR